MHGALDLHRVQALATQKDPIGQFGTRRVGCGMSEFAGVRILVWSHPPPVCGRRLVDVMSMQPVP